MAHNININNGVASFFSVNEKAWHGLGTIVSDYPNSADAMRFAGLDFTVEKRKLFTSPHEDGAPGIEVPDFYATVRTDNNSPLGVVGKDYEVVQNIDAFSFFDSIVGGEGIMYETAGALGNGERIFITAKLPSYIQVANNDLIEQYLFLSTSHDGMGSITAAFTPVRIVCNNTLNAAMRNKSNAIKIRHTANAKERLEQAHRLMGISNRLSIDLEQMFTHWSKVRITDTRLKELIRMAMVPNKEVMEKINTGNIDDLSTAFNNQCNKVYEYAMTSETQQLDSTKGTVFGAYNAITGYFQNVRSYKSQEAKLKSLVFGGVAQMRTQSAFDLCTQLANHDELILPMN
jgi:phage/plasmid-like protein (TIGR03299 family)